MLELAVFPVAIALIVQVGAEWEEIRTPFVFWIKWPKVHFTLLHVQCPLASHRWHVGR